MRWWIWAYYNFDRRRTSIFMWFQYLWITWSWRQKDKMDTRASYSWYLWRRITSNKNDSKQLQLDICVRSDGLAILLGQRFHWSLRPNYPWVSKEDRDQHRASDFYQYLYQWKTDCSLCSDKSVWNYSKMWALKRKHYLIDSWHRIPRFRLIKSPIHIWRSLPRGPMHIWPRN